MTTPDIPMPLRPTAHRGWIQRWPRLASARWPTRALLAMLACALFVLSACAPHPGGDEIAFIRNGQLWTVNSDGSSAVTLVNNSVVGFAWSPDHHQLVFRYGNATMPMSTLAAAPDAPTNLAISSVDGAGIVTITPQVAGIARSDAWWNANGNRLLYREGFPPSPGQEPQAVTYQVSQADQPAGIARKVVLDAATMPVLSADGSQIAVLDPQGAVRVGPPGAVGRVVTRGALLNLPGSNRPARLLWQPRQQDLLFAQPASSGDAAVTLMLTDLQGHTRVVGTASALLDDAFAPDGNMLLLRTASRFELWTLGGATGHTVVFSWPESDPNAMAWWSPDGRAVLVQDGAGLWLAAVHTRNVRQLLAVSGGAATAPDAPLWRPLVGSPWSADGQRIVFADPGTGRWEGKALAAPQGGSGGLYVASVTSGAAPTLINSGPDILPSWSYLDPSASVLVAS